MGIERISELTETEQANEDAREFGGMIDRLKETGGRVVPESWEVSLGEESITMMHPPDTPEATVGYTRYFVSDGEIKGSSAKNDVELNYARTMDLGPIERRALLGSLRSVLRRADLPEC